MSAIIRMDIEGTAEEIMAAFKTFVGEPEEIQVLNLDTVPREETDYVPELEYPGPRCAWCQTLLTQKQIDNKRTYCSQGCAGAAASTGRAKKKRAIEAQPAILGKTLKCLECNKPLTKKQKKFCSRACSNRYHHLARAMANVKVTHKPNKPITVVAGQGIIKGSALTI